MLLSDSALQFCPAILPFNFAYIFFFAISLQFSLRFFHAIFPCNFALKFCPTILPSDSALQFSRAIFSEIYPCNFSYFTLHFYPAILPCNFALQFCPENLPCNFAQQFCPENFAIWPSSVDQRFCYAILPSSFPINSAL
jgi:hypothetical protein